MAVLGRWTGGAKTQGDLPTTWTAPANLFDTQARNDGSAYTFTASTSTLTLPSSNLADGYLITAYFEYDNDQNARYNPRGRIVQASGTGTFEAAPNAGYSRNTSDDKAYVRCFAFVDNPSASSTYQFQWMRGGQSTSAGGTDKSVFEVIPLFYSDVGIYNGTDASLLGGTTRNTVALAGGTDGTNITRSGNVVTVTGDNKRYLVLSAQYYEGRTSRTQRVFGHTYDSTADEAAQSHAYFRDSSNDAGGGVIYDILETVTASRTIEITAYRGPAAFSDGGALADGVAPSLGDQALIVIELNDSAEVFRSHDATGLEEISSSTPIDLSCARNVDFNDTASFTSVVNSSINVVKADDILFGGNMFGARGNAEASGQDSLRLTHFLDITVNGTEDDNTRNGNFLRGDVANGECYGTGINPLGFVAATAGDDVGISATALSTSAAADTFTANADRTVPNGLGFWGINLDTLEGAAGVSITGAVTLDDWTTTGEIDVQNNITGAITLDDWTTDGTIAVQNDITGAVTLDDWTTDGAVQVAVDITGAVTLDDWTTDGTITVVDPITITGAVTLDDWTTTGTIEVPIDITGAITLDDWDTAGATSVDISTTGAITLDDWITAGTVEVDVSITGAVTLDDWTTDGTIEAPIDITGAVTLDDWTTTGTIATVAVTQITGAITLDDWTTDGAIQTDIAISGAVVLDDWGVNGTIQTDVDITGAVTLDDWATAGAVAVGVSLDGAITLDDWTTTGQIVLDAGVIVTGAVVLDDWQTAGQIEVDIDINGAIVLDDWVTDGIIDTGAEELDDGLGGGHGAIIRQQYRQKEEKTATTDEELMLLAVTAINEYYD